ncbi:hypothetical protein FRB96_000296 [Tulasnella sp. 330]|nr:hypothetical protein FRB96_000296 [Tulasnella sp. 330]KAG8871497.1 hypothetical protein FRB97_008615 [Tulasnella sp. 331]KAG8886950.1 hypothetical protein FRB98_000722 [Tulasnella sp. 332]
MLFSLCISFLTISKWQGLASPLQIHLAAPSQLQPWPVVDPLDPYPNKPRIHFRADSSFKLTVFSDLHFGENPWNVWGPIQDQKSVVVMQKMLKLEKPDFVAINGDLITGEDTFRENSTMLIDMLTGPLREARVPFASSHGNHDNSINITHLEEIEREQLIAPTSYTRRAPPGVGGDGGPGNYWVPVYAHEDDNFPCLIIWFFDSRSGVEAPRLINDWVDESVATWIAAETALMDAKWGPSELRAAIAFVHVPPHIMESLQPKRDPVTEPGMDGDVLGEGSTQSSLEIERFGADRDRPFWEALTKHVKNLHAVVSGHDHGNEWCTREPNTKQVLCFNKHTGYGGYSKPGWGHGVRTFHFTLQNLTSSVDTWITMENGTRIDAVTLDATYGVK